MMLKLSPKIVSFTLTRNLGGIHGSIAIFKQNENLKSVADFYGSRIGDGLIEKHSCASYPVGAKCPRNLQNHRKKSI